MKSIWIILILILACHMAMADAAPPNPKESASQIYAYEGRLFDGPKDPHYKDYVLALRNHLVRRIHQKFGVKIDPRLYSGFDLLEIESLIRFKKSNESIDSFLKMFPKTP